MSDVSDPAVSMNADKTDASKTPAQIGKYEILSELGRGGMGIVYRAEDKFIGREVAIKTLTAVTPELRQRFLVEARSGVLNHQNIVTVYDFGEQDGNPYIVMEFLQGESLERLLKEHRAFSLVDKLEIVRQVCEGLGYAHARGVVHRDIKPANIMVQPDGHIKIVDFGIARLESLSGQTVTGAVIGTFHYLAPERLKGESSDGRADIWAAGVVLYLLLTGRLPFPGDDISALHKVVSEPFERVSALVPSCPPPLEAVVDRALAKQPDERYGSAEEMAADLQATLDVLKRARVGEVLGQVKSLMDQEELTRVRPMLLELQRLAPDNTEVRRLLREVGERLSRQQRSEQVRQIAGHAEDAAREHRYAEALELFRQASRVDPANTGLLLRVEQMQELREKADRVQVLKTQAQDLRHRRDFDGAAQLIEQAIALDRNNTDLHNEQVRILQEQERAARDGNVRRLRETSRDHLVARQYPEALSTIQKALQLDPTDTETQGLYHEAVIRQEEDRRRGIIEQIVAEIQTQMAREQWEHALELIQRSLERLPGDAALLRMRAEAQAKIAATATQRLVEQTSLEVQNLLFSAPEQALTTVRAALERAPGDERLLSLEEQAVAQRRRVHLEGLRAEALGRGHTALEAGHYAEAADILEEALVECGTDLDLEALLDQVRQQRGKADRRTAAAASMAQAQTLLGKGDLEGAVTLLQRAVEDTQDAAVGQLLRQVREQAEEAARRVEALRERLRSVGEGDPAQALKLLGEQPETVQQHPEMRALRTRLQEQEEQDRAVVAAVARADGQLAAGKLPEAQETLETVRRAFGSFPAIAAAQVAFATRVLPAANGILQTAMTEARRRLLAGDAISALETVQGASGAVPFAASAIAADWRRLTEELEKAANRKANDGKADDGKPDDEKLSERKPSDGRVLPIAAQERKLNVKLLGGIAALLLLAVIAALFLRSKPAAPQSFLELDASPFAEVLSLTASRGGAFRLLPGSHTTPLRLEKVPQGTYAVVFRQANGTIKQLDCTVSEANHLCALFGTPLSDADVDAIIAGGKP